MITISRTVDLTKPVQVENLRGYVFTGEIGGHTFEFDGVSTGLTGYFMRANHTTIALQGSGNTLTLARDCYNVPGRFQLAVFATDGSDTTCIYAAVGAVVTSRDSTLIDSGSAVPTLDTLLAQIEACRDAAALANAAAVAQGEEAAEALISEMSVKRISGAISGSGSTTTLTLTNAAITADMEVVSWYIDDSSAVLGGLTWVTSAGRVTLTGVVSGSTNVTLWLAHGTQL